MSTHDCLTAKTSTKLLALFLLCGASGTAWSETVSVFVDKTIPQISFAAGDIKKALEGKGHTVTEKTLADLNAGVTGKKIVVARKSDSAVLTLLAAQGGSVSAGGLGEQAYAMRTTTTPAQSYWVIGGDANGAMYGGLQVAENINFKDLSGTYSEDESPKLKLRGIKFNIPWDERSETYFSNFEGTSHQEAVRLVWDMNFWTTWFDEMARHRYNALSLWSNHPFTSLMETPGYEYMTINGVKGFVSGSYDTEVQINNWTIAQKMKFWQDVMKYGHERGFDIYLMTWNIFLRSELNKVEMGKKGLTEEIWNQNTKNYIRKATKTLFEKFPHLNGFGVTVGENMGELESGADPTDKQKSQWAYEAYGEGVRDYALANPGRNITFIHRSWMAELSDIRDVFEPLQALPNVVVDISYKYAIGHAHAAPKPGYWENHDMNAECKANGFKSWLTIRNDDYYYLHWASPEFVKEFINGYDHDIVYATYVGSDGWTFTNNFASKDGYYQGAGAKKPYAIQKTWMMQKLWGRLGYNPAAADSSLFKDHIGFAYKLDSSKTNVLYDAWTTASRANCRVGELVTGDWNIDQDYWPEAWTDTDQKTGNRFLTLGLMPDGKSADKFMPPPGSAYANIYDSAQGNDLEGKKPAMENITLILSQSENALKKLAQFKAAHMLGSSDDQKELASLLKDIEGLSYLAQYGGNKLSARHALWEKAGTIASREAKARDFMGKAYAYWKKYTALMDANYKGANLQRNARLPSWTFNDAKALKEFTDLKGPTGTGALVSFSAPADLASFTAGTDVAVGVNVTITGRTVSKVELFSNNIKVGEDTTSPYGFTLTKLAAGVYDLEARVTDDTGAISYAVNTIASTTAVALKPDITSPDKVSATVGVPFSYSIAADNAPTNFGATGLPSGFGITGNVVSGTFSATGSFTFTVTAANATGDDSQLVTVAVASAANIPPTISNIPDSTINEDDTFGPINFTIGDAETLAGSLTVSAISSNTALVPTVTLGGSGATRTITMKPAANQSGAATITVTVNDGSVGTPDSFVLTVKAVNDAPAKAISLPDQPAQVGTDFAYTVPVNVFTDVDDVTLTWSASGIPAWLAFNPATRTFSGKPTAVGTATVTVKVTDSGGLNATNDFKIAVSAGPIDKTPTPTTKPTVTNPSSTTPTISGTAPVGSTIIIYDGANVLYTLKDIPTANWSYTVSPPLAPGSHTITYTVTEPSKSQSDKSLAETITVSAVTPAPTPTDSGSNGSSCGLGGGIAFILFLMVGLRWTTLAKLECKDV
jgi:Putative Ig domain